MLPSPPPLRTRRASFPAARSSLSNALLGTRLADSRCWSPPPASLRCLHDTHLEPTDVSVNLPPDGWPIHFRAGGCTNRIFRCHLLFLLSRFARFSREERPEGSLPAFAWSDVAKGSTPIHSITEWHSLFPSSSTRTAIDLPYGFSSQWERYGLTVFHLCVRVGEVLSFRRRSFVHDRESASPCADRAPFWFKPISIFGLL